MIMMTWVIHNHFKTSYINANFLSDYTKKLLIRLAISNHEPLNQIIVNAPPVLDENEEDDGSEDDDESEHDNESDDFGDSEDDESEVGESENEES